MTENLPKHVAIIMDGNGRWAKSRHLPRGMGHKAGVETARKIVKAVAEKGIKVLTLFVFSSENWRRPKTEVDTILGLFFNALEKEIVELHQNNVQLRVIGDRQKFSKALNQRIDKATELTKNNQGLTLVIAADYGGQWDIVQAAKQLAQEAVAGQLAVDSINAEAISRHLSLADLPDPDLFIRTSGEQRLSNFLLWQLAYAELYFADVHWPDFDATQLQKALAFFAQRQRRFGYTGDQISHLA